MRFLLLVLFLMFSVSNSYAKDDSVARKAYAEQLAKFKVYKENVKRGLTEEVSPVVIKKSEEDFTSSEETITTPVIILNGAELTEQKITDRGNMQKSILERRSNLQQRIADRRNSIQRNIKAKDNE